VENFRESKEYNTAISCELWKKNQKEKYLQDLAVRESEVCNK
jgi:hypothetical protein